MIILGIGGILGDAAAAILRDGELVAAVEESKLVRRRLNWGGASGLPEHSIAMCLQLAGVKPPQVDAVAVARPASAYFASPFDEATVLTLDRGGDFRCGSRWRAEGSRMTLEQEYYAPDSPGDLYGRVTELLGLEANADEHKVQWMSMHGDDRYKGLFL